MPAADLTQFATFTPSGLLGLCVVLIMFGYLVPLRMVKARLADKDAVIADLREANRVLKVNNDQLLRGSKATVQVLEAIPDAVSGGDQHAEVV